ncbi:MAG: hypothetical protein KTR19_08740 [Hyphomicrobiales bacterium]|nr:hypothetical protein [Hyphomicrobiales bacterium]
MAKPPVLLGSTAADVLLISEDLELKSIIANGFAEKKHFILKSIKGAVSETENFLNLDNLPGILLLDLKTAGTDDLAALERVKRGAFADVPVIALSSFLDHDIVRKLVQIKVDDWLPKDAPFTEIYRACEKLYRKPTAQKLSKDATCYSFIPASGGAGTTTLAIETAFLIGRTKRQIGSTCLVDLNFQDGCIADYLDITPSFRIEELSGSPGRLDRQLLDVMLSRHASGLAVLATPRIPGKFIDVEDGLIGQVLGLLSRSFDQVIIDLPKSWYPWMDNVIWGSNHVYVVTNFTVPALRHARYVLDAILAKAVNDARVSVVVNRHREKLLGGGLKKADAEQLMRDWLAGFIPDCTDLVHEAINRGMPVSEVSKGSKLEKALQRILAKSE